MPEARQRAGGVMSGGKSWGPENTRENGCPAALLAPAGPRVRRLTVAKAEAGSISPRTARRVLTSSRALRRQARVSGSPVNSQVPQARPSTSPQTRRDAKTKNPCEDTSATREVEEKAQASRVIEPRHGELADGVELR